MYTIPRVQYSMSFIIKKNLGGKSNGKFNIEKHYQGIS